MQLRSEQLEQHLRGGRLARCYVVCGDEPLLSLEAQDAIRAAARSQGYAERQVLHADARMDWSLLDQAASSLSLFSQRRLLEIRLPSGKPGKKGSESLQAHAQRDGADTLTIVSLPRLDRASRNSDWAGALQRAGVWIDIASITRDRLPDWIAARLARQRQSASRAGLDFLADRVEGNLLAAHQEIEKLQLLYAQGELSLSQIQAAVLDVARYEGNCLPGAMLAGDKLRLTRLICGLRAEGEPLPLLLWMVSEELRNLLRVKQALASGRPFDVAVRSARVSAAPALVERVLPSLGAERLARLLARCAELDRLAKGLPLANGDDDPWLELTELAFGLQPS